MDKKLPYRLINRIEWKSLLKGLLLFFLLLFLKVVGFTFLPLLLFSVVAFVLYIMEPPERKTLFISYSLLVISSILVIMALPNEFNVFGGVAFLYLLLFFVIFSFINFRFRDRNFIHCIINTLSIFSFFLAINTISFFSFYSFWSILELLVVFFGIKLFLRESFLFSQGSFGRRESLISGALSLLGLELLWIFKFLPFGIINMSAFLAISVGILRDFMLKDNKKELNTPFILRQITFFVVILLIFFAVSPWTI